MREKVSPVSTYGCIITEDRYTGTYSGGVWLAFPPGESLDDIDASDAFGGDTECREFWEDESQSGHIGRGATPQAALDDMVKRRAK